jgi:hypothetical protein
MTERKTEIAQAGATVGAGRFAVVQRATVELSSRVVDLATVELMSEAVMGATALAYERNEHSGLLVNVDPSTGRALYPLPWGRAGHTKWGIRPGECAELRVIMQARQDAAALWLYDKSRRSWFVNRGVYRGFDDAMHYWTAQPLTVAELRRARAHLVARRLGRSVVE